ncbi:TetR/AcrR family transcriptional regulator [Fictibacillus gelatini]|uniref:TetR/AcrR family transcriptional regulator n=1 Tax=Fictibacillus gelatini TaxID=225985 RepID=UPI000479833E|nr:TetR/AcrR family transcriptional regulator [Fictibacillus gelatini]
MLRMENKEDKKIRIIKAATRLFSSQGVRNTTVDQIAKKAGIGKGTVYYYYDDKTEILLDCYMQHIIRIREKAKNEHLSNADVVQRLQRLLQYISEESCHDPFVSTLFQEYKQARLPEISLCFKQSEEDAVRMVTHLLEEGINNGELENVPLPLTAFLLVRMMFSYNLDYRKSDKSDDEFLMLLRKMLLKN